MSSASQNSYDPQRPNFQNKDGEIGFAASSTIAAEEQTSSDVVLLTQRPRPDNGMNHNVSHSALQQSNCNNNDNVTYKAQIHTGSKCTMSRVIVKQKCFQSLPEGTFLIILTSLYLVEGGIGPLPGGLTNCCPSVLCHCCWVI